MNYELAAKLKDAGLECSLWTTKDHKEPHKGDELLPAPTLSELIEACGAEFNRLERDTVENHDSAIWIAYAWKLYKVKFGSTPEEAVANLWLAINKL